MKIERTKNAAKNIVFGMLLKIYQIIVPFLMRTAMIYCLGVEYLGLDSLFVSILQILNLAELGVGSAMVFSMYKPIAEDDTVTICALMKLYKIYYRIIGAIIFVLGIILCPFIPNLIKSDLPEGLNVYILYLMNLFATVLSYWLFAYKSCLLQAHQRNDVISKITIIASTGRYLFQFIVLLLLKNYYIYILITLLTQTIINIFTAIITKKIYPEYEAYGKLDKNIIEDINKKVKDLFVVKIGTIIVNSADTVVISAFLGLTTLAIYQNYYYIITSIIGLVGVVFSACSAGIGNSLIVETEEKNYDDLKKFSFIIVWLSGICTTCMISLFQPFMKWWVGEELLLPFSCVILLSIYYYIYEINTLLNSYKDSAGIWHKDKLRIIVTAASNFILNLILVNIIGIYGVILSTVLTILFIGMPWLTHNLFTEVFKRSSKQYVLQILKYTFTVFISVLISYCICSIINRYNILSLILRCIICVLVSNLIWIITYRKSNEMQGFITIVKRIIKK